MNKFKRAVLLYLMASGTVAGVAAVVTFWPRWAFGWPTAPYHVIYPPIWLLVVGLPSMWASADEIARLLGKKKPMRIVSTNQRSIPIMGDVLGIVPQFGQAQRSHHPAIDIADDFYFECDGTTIYQSEMKDFLNKAWRRQRYGQPTFSRKYFVRYFDKIDYLTMIELLEVHRLLKN